MKIYWYEFFNDYIFYFDNKFHHFDKDLYGDWSFQDDYIFDNFELICEVE